MSVSAVSVGNPTGSLFPPVRRLPGGYMGRVLRVNLSSETFEAVPLPEEAVLRRLWGGQALALHMLLRELPKDVRPLAPEAKVVMMAGPLTGTGLTPGGTKMCSVFLSPITGYTLGRAAMSGFWPVAVRAAGYDGLIIEGVAKRPSFLYLNDGHVELRDASAVWGKGTRQTEDLLREAVGREDARVACIGPAGEHLMRAAMLVNDYNHNAAHGLGALMGSKKLKAIVAHGTRRPTLRDRNRLIDAGRRWRRVLSPTAYTVQQRLKSPGYGAAWGAITRLNWRSTVITDEARGFDRNRVTLRPCFQCPRLCPWDVEIGEGVHRAKVGHFNAGSEWMDTFYNLGLKGNDVLYLTERTNDLGIECGHFANAAGLAFEAWEKGLLDANRTNGLSLEWGNLAAVERALEMCARREGWLGSLLAEGPEALAQALGGEAASWAVHTKGGSPAQHDWRPRISDMLDNLTGSGGMKSQGGGGFDRSPHDMRGQEQWGPLDPGRPEGWARSHLLSEQLKQACGLMGCCWFALIDIAADDALQSMADAFNAATGWNVDVAEMRDAGHRSIILQSLFGARHGWRAEHDWTHVGPRFLEPVPDGRHKGFTIARWLPDLVQEYYRLSGRHPVSGLPYRSTLERLGLGEYADWAAPDEPS
jgi:aldehyde:ferredoxin oxidoreductase